jgi:hypothetical protein
MAIDWETGKITTEQHVLPSEQLTPMLKTLEVGEVVYIEVDGLRADHSGALWLDPDADAFNEEEAADRSDDLYLCRVIKTEEGFVIDASAGDFILHPESEDTVPVDTRMDYESVNWFPVVGLISNDLQREQFGKILFENHDIVLARSVLMPPLEADPEDDVSSGGESTSV